MAAASLGSRKIETKRECERKFGACACMCVRVHVCVGVGVCAQVCSWAIRVENIVPLRMCKSE